MNVMTVRQRPPGKEIQMKVFTIDAENNITAHASAKAAPKTEGIEAFGTEKALGDLATAWPASRLIEIWNSLPGVTPVRKFKDRGTAAARIWKAIQNVGEVAAPQTPDAAPEEAAATTKAIRVPKPSVLPANATTPREGSKISRVIELLKREGGVTLKQLMAEMGWQSHTTRALMSAGGSLAGKHGLIVASI
jgi:hypothetical protein